MFVKVVTVSRRKNKASPYTAADESAGERN